jgi:hypothetical protein
VAGLIPTQQGSNFTKTKAGTGEEAVMKKICYCKTQTMNALLYSKQSRNLYHHMLNINCEQQSESMSNMG